MKPLCPTRWTVRAKAIAATLANYDCVLCTLEQISLKEKDNIGARASGLFKSLMDGNIFVAMQICLKVFDYLESFSKSLQKTSLLFSAGRAMCGTVIETLGGFRDTFVDDVWNKAVREISELDHNLKMMSW